MEESNKVKEVFYAYITRRINLIEALINDGNSFHKTIYETYGKEWQFDLSTLSDYLLPRLPSSTMLLNFTSDKVSEYSWLSTFIIQCKTWLLSNVVYSKWLGKENRGILFKKIDDMPKIKDIVLKVVKMKDYKYKDNDKDDEHIIQCDLCPEYALCIFWIWCGTCKKDTILYNCRLCSKLRKDICKSCNKFAKVVRHL